MWTERNFLALLSPFKIYSRNIWTCSTLKLFNVISTGSSRTELITFEIYQNLFAFAKLYECLACLEANSHTKMRAESMRMAVKSMRASDGQMFHLIETNLLWWKSCDNSFM